MNYYAARQIKDDKGNPTGKYHYTCKNGDVIFPVGYCGGIQGEVGGCAGHNSIEEANECYKRYLLDKCTHYDRRISDGLRPCKVCGEMANGAVQIGGFDRYVLCDNHRNRENVEKLFEVGSSSSSY